LAPALAAGRHDRAEAVGDYLGVRPSSWPASPKPAGIPPGVINVVCGFRETGEALVDHPLVAKVSFTGSVGAGRAIRRACGPAFGELHARARRQVAEHRLRGCEPGSGGGGSAGGNFRGGGADLRRRFARLHHQPIYDAFVDRIVKRAQQITIGDPLKTATQMGPVATRMQLEKDESMVARAVSEGAKVLTGGARQKLAEFPEGYFYQPTVVHQLSKDNFLMRNEVFGPVLAVTPFKDEAEVLALANDTEFGLAAGVWTKNINRAHKMARAIESGTVVDQYLPRPDVQLAVRRLQGERHRTPERHRGRVSVPANQERVVELGDEVQDSLHHESVKERG